MALDLTLRDIQVGLIKRAKFAAFGYQINRTIKASYFPGTFEASAVAMELGQVFPQLYTSWQCF